MKKNIWIINHYASEMFRTGGGRHHWFAKELQKQGYSPVIICSNIFYTTTTEGIDLKGKKIGFAERDGVSYVFIKTSKYKKNDVHRIKNILDFFINILRYSNTISQKYDKPELIIGSSVHPLACVAGIKLAHNYHVPSISEIRDLWPEELIRDDGLNEKGIVARFLFALEHWIYKKTDAIIFTQEGGAKYIRDRKWSTEQGGDIDLRKVFYINNGVDLEGFGLHLQKYKIEDRDLEDDSFKVIYTGAIRKTNGIDRLLNIAKKISSYKDIKILIWGDGDQVENINKRICNEHIDNVVYKGRVDKKYIPYILSRSNINILNYVSGNSFYYGCSNNKLFEYLAAGNPILCTVRMNYSIIEKYKCGIELEKDEDIVKYLVDQYNTGQKEQFKLSENVRQAAKEFDFKNHTKKLISIIENL